MLASLAAAARLSNPLKFRLGKHHCPLCRGDRTLVRLNDNEIAIRCLGCRASVVSLSIAAVIRQECPDLADLEVYELSSRGPLVNFLRRRCGHLAISEYFPDVDPGALHDGVPCQDVQRLTFADESFDLCTSTDVFEHVPDDRAGFREILRVLKPGGRFIFTVPLKPGETLVRAVLNARKEIDTLLPPEYHGDPLSPSGKILAFRTYGDDIVALLENTGFKRAGIVTPDLPAYWGIRRKVVVARKAGNPA